MKNIKIGVIGCGNMGTAIIRGLVKNKVASKKDIAVNDKDSKKANLLASRIGIRKAPLDRLVKKSEYIILAVKPQDSQGLIKEISYHIDTSKTVLSIMAGVTMNRIAELLGKPIPLCRAMPNMGAAFSKSATAVSFNNLVRNKKEIFRIFGSIGTVLEIKEGMMDAVTALSGSGPAYIFYFTDAMIAAGIKAGLKRTQAENLAIATVIGAAEALRVRKNVAIKDLILRVASKGGTTEAAIKEFENNKLKSTVKKAILKAKSRSKELSKG